MHIPDGFLSTPVWAAMDVTAAPVPEPTSLALMGLGAAGLLRVIRHRKA